MTAPASERHPVDPGAAPRHEPSIPVLRPLLPVSDPIGKVSTGFANSPVVSTKSRETDRSLLLFFRRRKREAAGLGAGIDAIESLYRARTRL